MYECVQGYGQRAWISVRRNIWLNAQTAEKETSQTGVGDASDSKAERDQISYCYVGGRVQKQCLRLGMVSRLKSTEKKGGWSGACGFQLFKSDIKHLHTQALIEHPVQMDSTHTFLYSQSQVQHAFRKKIQGYIHLVKIASGWAAGEPNK